MLPVPLINFLPNAFRDGEDPARDALCAKVDAIIEGLAGDARELLHLADPGAAPSEGLTAMGGMLEAGIGPVDAEEVKRRKIAGAIAWHKRRYTWEAVKGKIDAVTGFSASLYAEIEDNWSMRIADGSFYTDFGYEWSMRGGVAAGDGIVRIGAGYEYIVAGNIYIDVGTSGLTPAQVAQVVFSITADGVPAYFRIYLGYESAGAFVTYAGGIIG